MSHLVLHTHCRRKRSSFTIIIRTQFPFSITVPLVFPRISHNFPYVPATARFFLPEASSHNLHPIIGRFISYEEPFNSLFTTICFAFSTPQLPFIPVLGKEPPTPGTVIIAVRGAPATSQRSKGC